MNINLEDNKVILINQSIEAPKADFSAQLR
jgi:hypothetical protein